MGRMLCPPPEVGPVIALPVTEPWITRTQDGEEPVEAVYIGVDEALADLYKLKLEMDGYRVTLAQTGTEGLAYARQRVPDIVFLELAPADPSSLQTHRMLRRDRDLREIPVVLLWRGDADAPSIQSLGLGAKDFLVRANGSHSEQSWSDQSVSRLPFRYAQ